MTSELASSTELGPCSGLKPDRGLLTTSEIFPIDTGTKIAVSCEERFPMTRLRGNDTITCTAGTAFSSEITPTCDYPGTITVKEYCSLLLEHGKIKDIACVLSSNAD